MRIAVVVLFGFVAGVLFGFLVAPGGWGVASGAVEFALPRLGVPAGCGVGCGVLVPLVEPIDREFLEELLGVAENGGVVVVFDEGEFGEWLYRALGVNISNVVVRDPVMNFGGDAGAVRAAGVLEGRVFQGLYLYEPRLVEADGGLIGVLRSSEFSYLDLDGDGVFDWGEPIGSWVVGVVISVGRGVVAVIPDTEFISSRGLNDGSNRVFLEALLGGEGRYWLVLDGAGLDSFGKLRALLSGLFGGPSMLRALAGLVLLLVGVAVVYWFEAEPRLR